MCPMNAAPPARPVSTAWAWSLAARVASQAISTAKAPLPPSPSRVRAARSRRPLRSTLVAPMLPEPMARGSPAPAAFMTITPNGIEPSR